MGIPTHTSWLVEAKVEDKISESTGLITMVPLTNVSSQPFALAVVVKVKL